ncbi:AroB-related putative sugar phosphate phospholyase (cyclizing) [Trichlorobacter lovleyi]|uniref:AroB-related putative sugar phosphate phospholyase (cyclizing) n=1 Tax=Trichlorobacter lovleyi TaxID=313985 RepID=UPI003D0CA62A
MNINSYNKTYTVDTVDVIDLQNFVGSSVYLIVFDKKVYDIYKGTAFKDLDVSRAVFLEADENCKTIDAAVEICKIMAEIPFNKNSILISIGGGIIQDITGFAANIYNRGIRWIFIPTTLLAQCDSCIGGKTSLNLMNYKNILGTFYAPDRIMIDLNFVTTLSEDDYLSGLGEVAKFNIMAAHDGIELLERHIDRLLHRDIECLRAFLKRSLEFKKKFIEEDEFDKGVRNLLNFAHTFGHAFESVSHYAIPHGQAVTLGLLMANMISFDRGLLDHNLKCRIEKLCVRLISVKLDYHWFEPSSIIGAMKRDKKRTSEQLTAVLFKSDLGLEIVHDLRPEEVERSLLELISYLKLSKLC